MEDKDLIGKITLDLNKKGYTNVSIERALELEFGCIDKWITDGDVPPEARALFLLLMRYPMLIDVADLGFIRENKT